MAALNSQQQRAVNWQGGPLLVLAGAGSGKTLVITRRIVHLIQHRNVPAERIIAVTFTNKAAAEMSARVRQQLQRQRLKRQPRIATFHALGLRILRTHAHALGYRQDFSIYDSEDQLSLVKELLPEHQTENQIEINPQEALWLLQQRRSAGLPARADSSDLVQRLQAHYERELKALHAVDFEDLLLLPLRLLEQGGTIAETLHNDHDHLLVDEYQDTNTVQYRLIKALAARHDNLYVVGDDDQAIYQWRGAGPAQLRIFQEQHPQLEVVRLEQNYRSTSTILQAANAVISSNTGRIGKQLWGEQGTGRKLQWLLAENESEELEKICTHIHRTQKKHHAAWHDFAILYRANHQSRKWEEALRNTGIPYRLVGGTSFYERREIRTALAYLKLIHNPHDTLSLRRIINFPRRGVGQTSVKRLLELASHQNRLPFALLAECVAYSGFPEVALRGMAHLHDLCRRYQARDARGEPLGAMFRDLLAETQLTQALMREQQHLRARERVESRMNELAETIHQYGTRHEEPGLGTYLRHVMLFSTPEEQATHTQLQLMTVHAAKGLEFPYVYLVNMADDVFPSKRALEEGHEDEERRLAYVAITRARRQLVFSMAKTRTRWQKTEPQKPSRFILQIPQQLFEQGVPPREPPPREPPPSDNATTDGAQLSGRAYFMAALKKRQGKS